MKKVKNNLNICNIIMSMNDERGEPMKDDVEMIQKAIDYIEDNLLCINSSSDVSKEFYISDGVFQKKFRAITGYSVAKYIRNRRLHEAALEIINSDSSVLNIGMKYGYDTPEGFLRAFKKFFGINPNVMRKDKVLIKSFYPISLTEAEERQGGLHTGENNTVAKVSNNGRSGANDNSIVKVVNIIAVLIIIVAISLCSGNDKATQKTTEAEILLYGSQCIAEKGGK